MKYSNSAMPGNIISMAEVQAPQSNKYLVHSSARRYKWLLPKRFVKAWGLLSQDFTEGRTVYFPIQDRNIEKETHCKSLPNVYIGSVASFSV